MLDCYDLWRLNICISDSLKVTSFGRPTNCSISYSRPWWSGFINIPGCGILNFLKAHSSDSLLFPECDFKMLLSLKVAHWSSKRPPKTQKGTMMAVFRKNFVSFRSLHSSSSSCVCWRTERPAWWLIVYSFCCCCCCFRMVLMIWEKNSSRCRGTITRCIGIIKTDFHMADRFGRMINPLFTSHFINTAHSSIFSAPNRIGVLFGILLSAGLPLQLGESPIIKHQLPIK